MPEIRLPTDGAADKTPLRKQPWNVSPPRASLNVVSRVSDTGRKQITKRPALRKLFDVKLGDGQVQGVRSIALASAVTSFSIGDTTTLTDQTGVGRRSVKVDANAWLMPLQAGQSRGLRDTLKVYGAAGACRIQSGGASTYSQIAGVASFTTSPTPWATPVHPGGTLAAVLVNYTDTTAKTLIAFWDTATGSFMCCKVLSGADVAASACCWTDRALWIAKGGVLHYIQTPVSGGVASPEAVTSLTVHQAPGSPTGFLDAAGTITGIDQYVDPEGNCFMYCCFKGTSTAGTFTNPDGAITTGGYAKHFRAGLYRLQEVLQPDETLDFAIQDFGGAPALTDQYVEVSAGTPINHRSVRFSQVLGRAPRGCLPTACCCNASGDVAVTFTNQGYGPNSAFPPDGSRAYTTVAKFDSTGALLWEADPGSNVSGEDGGKLAGVGGTFPTDIPDEDGGNAGTTSKNGPALRSCDIDEFGDVYVSGRLGNGPALAFGFQSGSGNLKWPKNLADPAQLPGATGWASAGIVVADGSVFVISTRTTLWDPDQATDTEGYAILWRLSPVDGLLEWAYDITQNAPGVAPDDDPTPVCIAAAGNVLCWGSALFTD